MPKTGAKYTKTLKYSIKYRCCPLEIKMSFTKYHAYEPYFVELRTKRRLDNHLDGELYSGDNKGRFIHAGK